jgi:hypothetical protein
VHPPLCIHPASLPTLACRASAGKPGPLQLNHTAGHRCTPDGC